MNNIETIDCNYNHDTESFLYKLTEGTFDKGLYNKYVKSSDDLNNSDNLNNEDRLGIACKLWSISLEISKSLACDYNKIDVFTITGIDDNEKLRLLDILPIIPLYFQHRKMFDLADIFM